MRHRLTAASWWWLALAIVSALLLIAAMAAVVLSSVPVLPNLLIVSGMAFPVVGALVVARRPGNRMGRLLLVAAAWYSVGAAATTYSWLGLEVGALPAGDSVAWLATWAYAPFSLLIPVLVAVFPSGRVVSAWLRWPLRVAVTAEIVLLVVGGMILPAPVNVIVFGEAFRNPWGIEALAPLVSVWEVLWHIVAVLIVLTVIDLVLRWRESQGAERLQMRWFGLGLLLCAMLGVVAVATTIIGVADEFVWIWVAFWGFGFGALPVTIGVAVARYRLYEIDRLISRTVSYAVVVGVLVGVYAGGVFVLGGLLPLEGDLAVAASTLVVAGLFNPLRRRVQQRVDRRFNRPRYSAEREVERFSSRLRTDLHLDEVTGDLLGVVARTVQPSTTSVWLRGDRR